MVERPNQQHFLSNPVFFHGAAAIILIKSHRSLIKTWCKNFMPIPSIRIARSCVVTGAVLREKIFTKVLVYMQSCRDFNFFAKNTENRLLVTVFLKERLFRPKVFSRVSTEL